MMSKRLIALVEVLMVVSLFCTGFASWSVVIAQPDSILSLSTESYGVESNALGSYGLELLSEAYGVKAKNFEYVKTVVAGGSPVYRATNSTLSMLLRVDTATMAANANDYREQILFLTCSAKDQNGNARSFMPQDAGHNNQNGVSGYYKAPKLCKLTLVDYPSRTVTVDLSNNFDASGKINVDELTVKIPLVQLYNLAKDYMIRDGAGNLKTPTVIVELEFEANDDNIYIPCGWIYTFTAKVQ